MNRETAIKIAIEAIEDRQRDYVVGYNTWQLQPKAFLFAERDAKKYVRLEQAKKVLRDYHELEY